MQAHEIFVNGAVERSGFIVRRGVDILFRRTHPGTLFGYFTRADGQVVPLTRPSIAGDPEVVREPIAERTRPLARRVARDTNAAFHYAVQR